MVPVNSNKKEDRFSAVLFQFDSNLDRNLDLFLDLTRR
ncbi:hypothetical protein BH11CYA1_BH11CYA1_34460 [soil metagenome]